MSHSPTNPPSDSLTLIFPQWAINGLLSLLVLALAYNGISTIFNRENSHRWGQPLEYTNPLNNE